MSKKKSTQSTAPATSTALVKREITDLEPWEQELVADAEAAKAEVAGIGGGGIFASIRGGQLTINGNAVPGNEIACIVLAHVNAKAYYTVDFDADDPASPVCYAFGKEPMADLVPHDSSEEKQHDDCAGCPQNVFGTARVGKGKACKDQIRLAICEAGTLQEFVFHPYTQPKQLESAEVVQLNIPATSLKNFATFLRGIASTVLRPMFGVYTKIKVRPDAQTQVQVEFECLGLVPQSLIGVVKAKAATAADPLMQPYPKTEKTEAPAKKAPNTKKFARR